MSPKKSVPNAVSVLFRVFLEISLDEYMIQHKLKCGNKKNRCYDIYLVYFSHQDI